MKNVNENINMFWEINSVKLMLQMKNDNDNVDEKNDIPISQRIPLLQYLI